MASASLNTLLTKGSIDELRSAVALLAAICQANRHVVCHLDELGMSSSQVASLKGYGVDELVEAVQQLIAADQAYCAGIAAKVSAEESRIRNTAYRNAAENFFKLGHFFKIFRQ